MVRRHYFFELLLLRVRGLGNGLRGVHRPDVHLPACDHALQRCILAGRQAGWTGVRLSGLVCGCRAAEWHWWSAEEICLAWRGDMPEAQTGARYGAPRVAVPVVRCSHSRRADGSVCMCMCVSVCQKCRCLSMLVSCRRYELLLYVGLNIQCVFTCKELSNELPMRSCDQLVTGRLNMCHAICTGM